MFREAFTAGYSAGLARQVKQEIKMSLISDDSEVKECANALIDALEYDGNGVIDLVKLVNAGIVASPKDCLNELQDYYEDLNNTYNPDVFQLACKIIFDCVKVVADNLPIS